jgi:hypothetical protein
MPTQSNKASQWRGQKPCQLIGGAKVEDFNVCIYAILCWRPERNEGVCVSVQWELWAAWSCIYRCGEGGEVQASKCLCDWVWSGGDDRIRGLVKVVESHIAIRFSFDRNKSESVLFGALYVIIFCFMPLVRVQTFWWEYSRLMLRESATWKHRLS